MNDLRFVIVPGQWPEQQDRATYAEAIATATSFSTAIVGQAVDLLADLGLESPGSVIAPLVRSAVENALAAASGPELIPPGLFD